MGSIIKRIVSSTIIIASVLSIMSNDINVKAEDFNTIAANRIMDESPINSANVVNVKDIPECLSNEISEYNNYSARLFEKENALDTVMFANKDGTESAFIFYEDVKYKDKSGKITDKSNKLYSNIENKSFSADYLYVNKQNDINTYFPKCLKTDVGITVEAQGSAIEMYPISKMISPVKADNDMYGVYYDDVFGQDTGIHYEPSFSGYKEDIILERNVGNRFSFILETGDLLPVNENGVIYFRNDSNNDFGYISPIYVYDSFDGDSSTEKERHFTYNNQLNLKKLTEGKYQLDVIVDSTFLNSPSTVYPVIVDPSITINSTGSGSNKSILDTPIYNGSGVPGTSGVNAFAVVGYVDSLYGSGRLLMRFPGLMKKSFMNSDYTITSAKLTLSECSGGTSTSTIKAYNYTGPACNESTVYGSSIFNGVGSSIDYRSFSYPNYTTRKYNITSAVKTWQTNASQGNKGIIFKNTTSESDYSKTKSFYTTEGTVKPYLSVTYSYNGIKTNKYYSKYDPDKFNNLGDSPSVGQQTDLIQYRMNCYGYAFSNILNGKAKVNKYGGYKQQPGDFAKSDDKSKVKNNIVENNPQRSMANIVSNLKLDAKRMGYTITEYNPSSTVAQYGDSSRLIAVVTGKQDYHFYMQHNDGKWSHKPGSAEITNLSLTSKKVLTNSNIKIYANEGAYKNGSLKFFIITKAAVIDQPHSDRSLNLLYHKELAGDYFKTAVTKTTGSTSARIDFAKDHDVYCFKATSTKTYTIKTSGSSESDLDCKIYDATGSLLKTNTAVGEANTTISLSAGRTYFIDIYNYKQKVTNYVFTIS